MAIAKKTTAVATVDELKTSTALTTVVDDSGYGDYEGAGFENQDKEDYSLPFIHILQGLSPQLETIDGASPGKIINTVTNDLYPGKEGGVVFVPAHTIHCFVEWKPKEQGGGFVAQHGLTADVVVHAKETQDFGSFKTPSGNELTETFYVYGVLVNGDGGDQAVIAFTSTKIKKYKAWMTKARSIQIAIKDAEGRVLRRITPPLFAHRFRLTTVKEKNSKGEFFNWNINFDGADAAACRISPKSDLFLSAAAVATMVQDGAAKVDYNKQGGAEDVVNTTGGAAASSGGDSSDDAPF